MRRRFQLQSLLAFSFSVLSLSVVAQPAASLPDLQAQSACAARGLPGSKCSAPAARSRAYAEAMMAGMESGADGAAVGQVGADQAARGAADSFAQAAAGLAGKHVANAVPVSAAPAAAALDPRVVCTRSTTEAARARLGRGLTPAEVLSIVGTCSKR